MNSYYLRSKLHLVLIGIIVLGFASRVMSQTLPQVQVRFADPQFDKETSIYSVGVEMQTDQAGRQLFGMNVRFFLDPSKLEFLYLDDFQKGYGILGAPPQALTGHHSSGFTLFDFEEAAAYVNGAIQLKERAASVEISNKGWTRFFRAYFKVRETALESADFYPSLIWDLKESDSKSGFLRGSQGLVITLVEDNPTTREESAPTLVKGVPFNWKYSGFTGMPYGNPIPETGVDLKGSTAPLQGPVKRILLTHSLGQNHPNPFAETTQINFSLPEAKEARLTFYDVSGRVLHVLEGEYAAGQNSVTIDRKDLVDPSATAFYRLQTKDYTSELRKMTLINK